MDGLSIKTIILYDALKPLLDQSKYEKLKRERLLGYAFPTPQETFKCSQKNIPKNTPKNSR